MVRLKLQGVPSRVSFAHWSKKFESFTPAEIELVLLDAQRKWVLSGAKTLGEQHLQAALHRRRQTSSS